VNRRQDHFTPPFSPHRLRPAHDPAGSEAVRTGGTLRAFSGRSAEVEHGAPAGTAARLPPLCPGGGLFGGTFDAI
jgi:hypothetical protein